MDPSTEGRSRATLSVEYLSVLAGGISLVLSQWFALQIAIQNEWGGRDSLQKSAQLASDIVNWFAHSKDELYIDDLENMLDESMVLSFNSEIEDGSIEEVAEQLMIVHEECLQGTYQSIENLRKCNEGAQPVRQCRQVVNDDDESSDEEASNMVVDEMKPKLKDMVMHEPKQEASSMEAEEGWFLVTTRRNQGKKC